MRASLLRDNAEILLDAGSDKLTPLLASYRAALSTDVSPKQFADLYAQTFAYGLFLAWMRHDDKTPFDQKTAVRLLPEAVAPIRALIRFGLTDLPPELDWIVSGIIGDLAKAKRTAALGAKQKDGKEPMIHFYETFLAAYDKTLRKATGTYYTPEPVTDFIVRAVDDILASPGFGENGQGLDGGLANPAVRLLDPATGTGTFLARAYRRVKKRMTDTEDAKLFPDRARDHLAKNFYGFELLPAAYTLAHLNLRTLLQDEGFTLSDTERLPVYLANTLTDDVLPQQEMILSREFSTEVRAADKVKKAADVLVVIGNPPYSGNSNNPSYNFEERNGRRVQTTLNPIGKLLQDYYFVDGVPLGERNPKWLQNDYVKFIRFAEDMIARRGSGIVAYITDNSYLDAPTFRGMRHHLLQTFDALYVLDLHGNSKKRETAPDGSPDINVFDITQGVAILLAIKYPRTEPAAKGDNAAIYHANIYGSRAHKYETLSKTDRHTTDWQELTPNAPHYLFVPQDELTRTEYEAGWSVKNIFPVSSMGVTTGSDGERVGFNIDNLDGDTSIYNYRPMDKRFVVLKSAVRPRTDIMRNMEKENIALLTTRGIRDQNISHFFVTDCVTDKNTLSILDNAFMMPLYTYPTGNNLLDTGTERRPNLAPVFVVALIEAVSYKRKGVDAAKDGLFVKNSPKSPENSAVFSDNSGGALTPEAIFHYIYAVLHAPAYRTRYADFLKRDFPRIPLPPTREAFDNAATIGERLVALHLLTAPELKQTGIGYPVSGDHFVKKIANRYDASAQTVWLNDTERFENVSPAAWNHRVGGYQPAQKWLDDRAGRILTEADITHYRRLIAAQRETVALLPDCDTAFYRVVPNAAPTNAEPSAV